MDTQEMNTLVALLKKWATVHCGDDWEHSLTTARNRKTGAVATLDVPRINPEAARAERRPDAA